MKQKLAQAGLLALLLLPTWSAVHAIDVPLQRLELVPFTASDSEQPKAPVQRLPDEAVREPEAPRHTPFQYDVMPEDDDHEVPQDQQMLDIRGA